MIISAYINIQRNSPNVKSLQDYLRYAEPLLNLDYPKVIFLEQETISEIKNYHPSTILIPLSKSDIWYKFSTPDLPSQGNKEKDTFEYLATQLNKTDWILKAYKLFPNQKQFVWVDFGITHICPSPHFGMLKKHYDKIRIPGCIIPSTIKDSYISHDKPNWFFCGGLFGGNIEKIISFDFLIKHYASELYLDKKKITWEVNIWALIYRDFPELFDWYYSDHDCGMINGY